MPIEQIHDLPAGTLGFRGTGLVSADDYRAALEPAIDAAVEAGGPVNLVYVLGDDFERYSLGAMWEDARLEGVPHRAWGRFALVTGHEVLAEAVHLMSFLFPGELRIFPGHHEADAIAWASGASED
ncbi:STAS/SEC14 domain-containing protein [Demequina rhizosphaerae]|uniref:STAS/SEC14 domain-containing protein n=1 Tax=Demequina rhizosphaerae TaxID=1638985 RepID=UPI000782CD7A|nr:STAS/SEC14 domain-containing protein [Demequina rhizosphaerae]